MSLPEKHGGKKKEIESVEDPKGANMHGICLENRKVITPC